MAEEKSLLENLIQELRRGTLILSVLSQLNEATYGYALVEQLEQKGVFIDPNTLYPLLRRLEKQGHLCSEWQIGASTPRKYYKRTILGDEIFQELKKQWKNLSVSMDSLLEED